MDNPTDEEALTLDELIRRLDAKSPLLHLEYLPMPKLNLYSADDFYRYRW